MSDYLGNMIDAKYTDDSIHVRNAKNCGHMQALLISIEILMNAYDTAECGDEALGSSMRTLIKESKQEIEDNKAES